MNWEVPHSEEAPVPNKKILALLAAVVSGFLTTAAPAFAVHRTQVLHRFSGNDGEFPYYASLVFDTAGNLYGTTFYGGNFGGGCGYGCGTVFKLTPGAKGKWTETVLHKFQNDGLDGYYPAAGLTIDAAGNLYGTTTEGGTNRVGTVFKLALKANGSYSETVLHSFCSAYNCTDGEWPYAGLIFDAAGNLYGTTSQGGANGVGGTVFRLSPGTGGKWDETVLFSFSGAGGPYAGVIFDKEGNLYGTTSTMYGACGFGGTVFELKADANQRWTETVLHSFQSNGKDGYCPTASLIFDPEGNLYGTTSFGGIYDAGIVFELIPGRNNDWTERIMHSFNINDGAQPSAGLIRDSSGNLYGTLAYGGKYGLGSVFKLTPKERGVSPPWATEQVLLSFGGGDGIYPFTGLTFDAIGNMYGATYYGGNLSDCSYTGCGVIFEITP
jgi:uncharacterized repeat protein (TIGR03803 family)